jgi:hypothetical protein
MLGDGDDAGHCSNGLSAQHYHEDSAEDRATFRVWMRGVIVFYTSVFMLSGLVAIVSTRDVGLTRLANLYTQATAVPPRIGPK